MLRASTMMLLILLFAVQSAVSSESRGTPESGALLHVAVLSDELAPADLLIDGEVAQPSIAAHQFQSVIVDQEGDYRIAFEDSGGGLHEYRQSVPFVDQGEYFAVFANVGNESTVTVAIELQTNPSEGRWRLRFFNLHPDSMPAGVYFTDQVFEVIGPLTLNILPSGASFYEEVQTGPMILGVDLNGDQFPDGHFRLDELEGRRGNIFIAERDDEIALYLVDGAGNSTELEKLVDPEPTPTPSPTPTPGPVGDVFFDFEANEEGWLFAAPPGFSAPDGEYTTGSLGLGISDNSNSFGWWESPVLSGTPERAIAGDVLYRVQAGIRSNLDDSSLAPEFRLRLWQEGFAVTDAFNVTSTGDGQYSPSIEPRLYTHWVEMAGEVAIQVSFDILAFDATNAESAELWLDELAIQSFSPADLTGLDEVVRYDFRNGRANGFGAATAPPFLAPDFGVSPFGLSVSAVLEEPSDTVFGFWTRNSGIELEPNRLYAASFTLSSSAEEANELLLPAFRLRQNESGFQFSQSKNVESVEGSRLPIRQRAQTYTLLFETPPDFEERRWIPSFDYLWIAGSGNDGRLLLYLEELVLNSWQIPMSPEVSR